MISSVVPSGADRATESVAMMVPAPGRFSTTNLLPARCVDLLADQPRQDVGRSAGRKRHDDADRLVAQVLRAPPLPNGKTTAQARASEDRSCYEFQDISPMRTYSVRRLGVLDEIVGRFRAP